MGSYYRFYTMYSIVPKKVVYRLKCTRKPPMTPCVGNILFKGKIATAKDMGSYYRFYTMYSIVSKTQSITK